MAHAVRVNFSFQDKKGKTSHTSVYVPTGFSINQYLEFGVAMAQIMGNLSDGAITEVSVSLPINLSGATIRAAALGIADVAEKLLIMAKTAVGNFFARFNIPTYNEANTIVGTDEADTADADIAALIAIIENGVDISGEVIQPIDVRGNDLDEVTSAREIFRKSG